MKNFAAIAAPLHSLLNGGSKKKSSVCIKQTWPDCWTEKCEQAFNTWKSKLTTAPLLVYPSLDHLCWRKMPALMASVLCSPKIRKKEELSLVMQVYDSDPMKST